MTFKDLERPICDVLIEHNMITPELQRGLTVAKVNKTVDLCSVEVRCCASYGLRVTSL